MYAKSGPSKNKNSRVALRMDFIIFFSLLSFCLCIIYSESLLHAPFSHAVAESTEIVNTNARKSANEIEKTMWNDLNKKVRHFSFW